MAQFQGITGQQQADLHAPAIEPDAVGAAQILDPPPARLGVLQQSMHHADCGVWQDDGVAPMSPYEQATWFELDRAVGFIGGKNDERTHVWKAGPYRSKSQKVVWMTRANSGLDVVAIEAA